MTHFVFNIDKDQYVAKKETILLTEHYLEDQEKFDWTIQFEGPSGVRNLFISKEDYEEIKRRLVSKKI